ncbi:MAG: methionyl-tRNA formyltransferase [Candidatus Dojkabacteria bacterium]|nr:methionyl-tRNA formyltransferase [Candidatus Dojkabacteria bacterium]MDQ7020356.1 methionyl-tRNA formyltransferase [Candidatus Dojkabacteria bacterium]
MKKIKTLFMGTSEFAVPVLEGLLEAEEIEVTGVITQPDRPAGRKQELKPSPLKEAVGRLNSKMALHQPERISRFKKHIFEEIKPDLIIVAAYGQIIPGSILEFPKFKCLNVHGSLLPVLRGAVPIHMAILQGLEKTGNTLQIMSKKMDEGPIVSTREIQLEGKEYFSELFDKLAKLAKKQIVEDISKWVRGELTPKDQDDSKATYCFMDDIKKEKAEITEGTSVIKAERMVRAFNLWPVAWFQLRESSNKGKRIKTFKSKLANLVINNVPDMALFENDGDLYLKLKDGVLLLEEIQLEGKQRREGKEYLYLID